MPAGSRSECLMHPCSPGSPALTKRLEKELRLRLAQVTDDERRSFVSSELDVVELALRSVVEHELATGAVFCEWGSGLGAVCALAASLGFEAYGIEIHGGLVEQSREVVAELGLDAAFAHGSYLLPGDEDLVVDAEHTRNEFSTDAYRELGLAPEACHVVFAYPWPGEEEAHDRLFARRSAPGALLLTYHETSRILVQRYTGDADELESLGWLSSRDD